MLGQLLAIRDRVYLGKFWGSHPEEEQIESILMKVIKGDFALTTTQSPYTASIWSKVP